MKLCELFIYIQIKGRERKRKKNGLLLFSKKIEQTATLSISIPYLSHTGIKESHRHKPSSRISHDDFLTDCFLLLLTASRTRTTRFTSNHLLSSLSRLLRKEPDVGI